MHWSRTFALPAAVLVASLAAGGCQSSESAPRDAAIRDLGESYRCALGEVLVIRVQDEFRLLRVVAPENAATYSYDQVFKIDRDLITDDPNAQPPYVRWNSWIEVPDGRGLLLMFLTPERVGFKQLGS